MSDSVRFSRRPYTVTYTDLKGEKQTIKRRPPLKAHDMLPKDVVTLKSKRSDDFEAGEELTIKHIPEKHANTLQVENSEGQTTFVDYFEVALEDRIAERVGEDPTENVIKNAYLMWP